MVCTVVCKFILLLCMLYAEVCDVFFLRPGDLCWPLVLCYWPFLLRLILDCPPGMLTLEFMLVLIELTDDAKLSAIWLPTDVIGWNRSLSLSLSSAESTIIQFFQYIRVVLFYGTGKYSEGSTSVTKNIKPMIRRQSIQIQRCLMSWNRVATLGSAREQLDTYIF